MYLGWEAHRAEVLEECIDVFAFDRLSLFSAQKQRWDSGKRIQIEQTEKEMVLRMIVDSRHYIA